jgi:transmembrane sensor
LTTDYSTYQVEDFVADPFFIKWVKSPGVEHISFWNAFLSKHPEARGRIDEARQIILQLDFRRDALPEGKFVELWDNINRGKMTTEETVHPASVNRRMGTKFIFYSVAASILFLIMAGIGYFRYFYSITITTTYGESRSLFLPDSTKVTLNSNSELAYSPYDFARHQRSVSLKGEGFFAVTHQEDKSNFIVHTRELYVEVLGTRFNVNSRRGKTQVVLQEGKVLLDMSGAPMLMEPGELVESTGKHETAVKRKVDTGNYSAWRNNRLVFSRTSLTDITQLLEDNYGYKVVLREAELADRKFTGTCSSENLDELFEKLSIVFELEITQSANEITIQYKKEKPKQSSRQ